MPGQPFGSAESGIWGWSDASRRPGVFETLPGVVVEVLDPDADDYGALARAVAAMELEPSEGQPYYTRGWLFAKALPAFRCTGCESPA